MALFTAAQIDNINAIAAKSNEVLKPAKTVNARSINDDLREMSEAVKSYFPNSPAILITTKEELHEYIDRAIEAGYVGYDTETTGLDRVHDTIVGCSLYYPGGVECYIPNNHIVPIFETPYKNQLTYQDVGEELQRLVDSNVKMILANADFDIAMTYKDYKVDIIDAVYYDVILAWRCVKENEKDNSLKGLYAKYPMRSSVNPKKFSDFFPVKLFPYCKPDVAKVYAANDAEITYELFLWQLPYVTKGSPKCTKAHLEKIADLLWNIELPMIRVCAELHRSGMYIDQSIYSALHNRYQDNRAAHEAELSAQVQELINEKDIAANSRRPFRTGADFNSNSPVHVKYLVNTLLGKQASSTDKDVLKEINLPVTNSILKLRGDVKLLSTYVDKLPNCTAPWDNRIHGTFKSIGAATGRMASSDPNLQNIPSKSHDIRHLFRAAPEEIEDITLSTNSGNLMLTLNPCDSVLCNGEWRYVEDITSGDILSLVNEQGLDESFRVDSVEYDSGLYTVILSLLVN